MFNSSERMCFIIGPMKDKRLVRLKDEVVKPLLDELGEADGIRYNVLTPFDTGGDHIMKDVIYAIDRADIIVADLSTQNPNVFYELGICHSLGKPTINVAHDAPFDISAYRYYAIDIGTDAEHEQRSPAMQEAAYNDARKALREPMEKAHRDVDWARFENPVIDFYRAPITFISPAYSLAQGYYTNFVRPVVQSIIERKGSGRYIYDIGISTDDRPEPRELAEAHLLEDDIREKLVLNIIIPEQITYSQNNYVGKLLYRIPSAVVETRRRTMSCYYRTAADGTQPALVDIPTTIRAMRDAVDRRMRNKNPSQDDPEWRRVEKQEVERFILNLQLLIEKHESNPEFKEHINILRYNPLEPGDMQWLHEIMTGAG
ncbi:MAG: STING domain-containing protein [Chloroflexota bacterium]